MMSGIRSKDTKPELIIRRGLHRRGFRFRLHDRRLPGRPDLVLPKYRAIVFIHGCFWHGHDCPLFRLPSARTDFWRNKIDRNRENDERACHLLEKAGWRLGTVWECALKGPGRWPADAIADELAAWLAGSEAQKVFRGSR